MTRKLPSPPICTAKSLTGPGLTTASVGPGDVSAPNSWCSEGGRRLTSTSDTDPNSIAARASATREQILLQPSAWTPAKTTTLGAWELGKTNTRRTSLTHCGPALRGRPGGLEGRRPAEHCSTARQVFSVCLLAAKRQNFCSTSPPTADAGFLFRDSNHSLCFQAALSRSWESTTFFTKNHQPTRWLPKSAVLACVFQTKAISNRTGTLIKEVKPTKRIEPALRRLDMDRWRDRICDSRSWLEQGEFAVIDILDSTDFHRSAEGENQR